MSVQREIGIFEAKTHLSELVSEVEAGASMILTRRGVPVARLVPVAKHSERATALARLKELGARIRADNAGFTVQEIHQWRDEGRR